MEANVLDVDVKSTANLKRTNKNKNTETSELFNVLRVCSAGMFQKFLKYSASMNS